MNEYYINKNVVPTILRRDRRGSFETFFQGLLAFYFEREKKPYVLAFIIFGFHFVAASK